MTNKSLFFLFIFLFFTVGALYFNADHFEGEEYKNIIFLNIILHCSAFIFSLKLLKSQKIPFLSIISALNIVEFGVVCLFIPKEYYQLGTFKYLILYDVFFGFLLFYTTYFILNVFKSSIKHTESKDDRVYQDIYLNRFLIIGTILSFIIEFPISGFNEIIRQMLFGFYLIGFFQGKNKSVDNVFLAVIFLLLIVQALTSGMVFAIVHLFIFIFPLFIIHGFNSLKSRLLIGFLLIFIGLFSATFSRVKDSFREQAWELESTIEKVDILYTLLDSDKKETAVELTEEQEIKSSTFWRLSYTLSSISLVNEKTPSIVPYWDGESYLPIFFKLIPRAIWPSKPKEEMGQKFGHRYKIIRDDDTRTSMNTPIITEAYMNFGVIGFYSIFIFLAILVSNVFSTMNKRQNKNEILASLILGQLCVNYIQWESNLSMLVGKIIILFLIKLIFERYINLILNSKIRT